MTESICCGASLTLSFMSHIISESGLCRLATLPSWKPMCLGKSTDRHRECVCICVCVGGQVGGGAGALSVLSALSGSDPDRATDDWRCTLQSFCIEPTHTSSACKKKTPGRIGGNRMTIKQVDKAGLSL